VVVAVPLVGMVQVALDKIVSVVAVRNRLMSTTGPMRVPAVVRSAGMARGAGGRIRATFAEGMFIHMARVGVVKMTLVQVVNVILVFNGGVSAA
jgi:hypothetical protein